MLELVLQQLPSCGDMTASTSIGLNFDKLESVNTLTPKEIHDWETIMLILTKIKVMQLNNYRTIKKIRQTVIMCFAIRSTNACTISTTNNENNLCNIMV